MSFAAGAIKAAQIVKALGEVAQAAAETKGDAQGDLRLVKAVGKAFGAAAGKGEAQPMKRPDTNLESQKPLVSRLPGIEGAHQYSGEASLVKALEKSSPSQALTIFVASARKLAEATKVLAHWADARGVEVSSRQERYLIGPSVEPGSLTTEPLPGGVGELVFNKPTDPAITPLDLMRASAKVPVLLTVAFSPKVAAAVSAAGSLGEPLSEASSAPPLNDGLSALSPQGGPASRFAEAESLPSRELSLGSPEPVLDRPMVEVGDTASASSWVSPPEIAPGAIFTPANLAERLHQMDSKAQLEGLCSAVYSRSERFSRLCDSYALKMAEARGKSLTEMVKVARGLRQHVAGEFGRQFCLELFRPYFTEAHLEVFVRTSLGGTKIDILLKGAKAPIIGHNFYVPKGGSLAIEVKSRMSDGFSLEEMQRQAESRHFADASLTIVSRDFDEAALEVQKLLRRELKDIAPIHKLGPSKARMDEAVGHLVSNLVRMRPVPTAGD